jgi:hypothetical protein
MAFFAFSHRFGTLFVIYGIRLRVIVVFTYATVFNILFFGGLPCPETAFLPRRNRDSERRCYMIAIFIEGSGRIRFD